MKIKEDIGVVVGCRGDDVVHEIPVIGLVAALVPEPAVLIEGNADNVGFPIGGGLGDGRQNIAPWSIAGTKPFHAGDIDSPKPDRTSSADG